MSAKSFVSNSIKFIPQMDFEAKTSDNGGVEATQSFLVRKSDIGIGSNLNNFRRGARAEELDPNTPVLYKNLTVKNIEPSDHTAPGWMKMAVTYTGYLYSKGASSGEEQTVPTYSLVGNLEEAPLNEFAAWKNLEDASKNRLGWLQNNTSGTTFNLSTSEYGHISDETGNFEPFPTDLGIWAVPTGDELTFAKMIASGRTTGKKPSWTYSIREESESGFTSSQLAQLGKIVANPPGDPVNPGAGWTWMLVGPQQEQDGDSRFFKDLQFLLIEDNEENQMLYGS